jgi:hypothetical protein
MGTPRYLVTTSEIDTNQPPFLVHSLIVSRETLRPLNLIDLLREGENLSRYRNILKFTHEMNPE